MGVLLSFIAFLALIGVWVNGVEASASHTYVPMTSSAATEDAPFRKKRFRLHELHLNTITSKHHENKPDQHDFFKSTLEIVLKNRAGATAKTSLLPMSISVINHTLNIATASIVGSGLLGSWVASYMIFKMRKLTSSVADRFHKKWSLSIASCVVFFIIKFQEIIAGIYKRNLIESLFGVNDLGVLFAILAYSKMVEPILGGLIGSSYVALDIASSLLSSGTGLSELMKFRLAPLNSNGNSVHTEQKIYDSNNLTMKTMLANVLSSMSLFTSMPKYFLGLYMISNVILNCSGKSNQKWYGNIITWFKAGFPDETNGKPLSLTHRLFVLHLAIMAIKGGLAIICL